MPTCSVSGVPYATHSQLTPLSFSRAAVVDRVASTHAMARDSCGLPRQNIWLPLVWQERQAAFRSSTGVLESLVKRTGIVSLPPPASTWALPGR